MTTLLSRATLIYISLLFLFIGTLVELLLLGHFEDVWQLVPLIILGAALLCFAILQFSTSDILALIFRIIMVGSMVSGLLGVWFHLKANYEFEVEMYPNIGGWKLVTEMLTGAIPALAPGSMVVVGLIGILYTLEKSNNHE
ncbi:MAG: hypothetical protein AAGC88_02170 [Bacteroidota bacterium]